MSFAEIKERDKGSIHAEGYEVEEGEKDSRALRIRDDPPS